MNSPFSESNFTARLAGCPQITEEMHLLYQRLSGIPDRNPYNNPKLKKFFDFIDQDQNTFLENASDEFFRTLPAADLHIHGGGLASIELATEIAWQRSEETDRKLQTIFGSKDHLIEKLSHPIPGLLDDYLTKYHLIRDYLFTTLEDIETICHQGSLEAFFNGTCLLEIRSSIKSGEFGDRLSKSKMEHVNFSPLEEFEAMVRGIEKAKVESGGCLQAYIIISFRRGDTIENCMKTLEEAHKIKIHIQKKFGHDYIRAIDIAGQEYGDVNKAKRLKDVFTKAREYGFLSTAHSGEDYGVGEGGILHALNHLEVDRIGHGTSLYKPTPMLHETVIHSKDGEVKNAFIELLRRGVPLETCLTSNLMCGAQITTYYTPQEDGRPKPLLRNLTAISQYPFEILVALGDLVANDKKEIAPIISTDGIFSLNTNLAREYSVAASEFNLNIRDVLALCYLSIEHSFAPQESKDYAIERNWLPFAKLFFFDPNFDSPIEEMSEHLANWRHSLKSKLHVDPQLVEMINQEVQN